MKNISKNIDYRPDIDGLRGIAVIAVILNHLNPKILPSGYLGVDIFFVISGFVITSSLKKRQFENFKDFITGFYGRRIKRLFPALIFFVFISSLLIMMVVHDPKIYLRTGISSLFGLSNFYLILQSTNYFALETLLNPFTHTWSLAVEEQFYFVYPLIIWLSGFAKNLKNSTKHLTQTLLCLSFISFISFIYFYRTNLTLGYFLMPTRFWEMSAGGLLFLSTLRNNYFIKTISQLNPILPLLLIFGIFFLPTNLGILGTPLIIIFSSTLILSLKKSTLAFKLLTNKNTLIIGLMSYSLYLWHWSIISIFKWSIGITLYSIPFVIICTMLISVFSYKNLELPIKNSQFIYPNKFVIKSILFISVFLSLGLFFMVNKYFYRNFYIGRNSNEVNLKQNYSLSIKGKEYTWLGEKCVFNNDDVLKRIDDFNIENCILGDFNNSKRRIIIFGNSIAPSFIQSFDKLLKNDYSIALISTFGIPPTRNIPSNNYTGIRNEYEFYKTLFPELISSLKEEDILFMISDKLNLITKKNRINNLPIDKNLELYESGIEKLILDLKKNNIKLAVLRPLPHPPKCFFLFPEWFRINDLKNCNRPLKINSKVLRQPINERINNIQAKYPKELYTLDLENIFCPEKNCDFYDNKGNLLFRDNIHPSNKGAELSSNKIFEFIKQIP